MGLSYSLSLKMNKICFPAAIFSPSISPVCITGSYNIDSKVFNAYAKSPFGDPGL